MIRLAQNLSGTNIHLGLILNPEHGELKNNRAAVLQIYDDMTAENPRVLPAWIVNSGTVFQDAMDLAGLCPEAGVIFIHKAEADHTVVSQLLALPGFHLFQSGCVGSQYIASFSSKPCGLLEDGFQSQQRNSDYPVQSFFSDQFYQHKQQGFSGFGDYTITGDNYSESGGSPFAIAIHITEAQSSSIICNHFVSQSNATRADQAGKFKEAVKALAVYSQNNPGAIDFSAGCQQFLTHYANGHYPSLGKIKEHSMQHHLELMCRLV